MIERKKLFPKEYQDTVIRQKGKTPGLLVLVAVLSHNISVPFHIETLVLAPIMWVFFIMQLSLKQQFKDTDFFLFCVCAIFNKWLPR